MISKKIKLIFIGTPEFGAIILKELVRQGCKPILVVSAPDKPVGRKQILTPPPVKLLAQEYKIQVIQPAKIENEKKQIKNAKPDLIVVAAYGQIIPKDILEIPKRGCLNVHPSLLPKYRGPSPIQSAILNGDQETGTTIMKITEKLDSGPIIAKVKYQLSNNKHSYPELHDKLADLGAKLLIETIPKWIKGEIKPKLQTETEASYTVMIKKENGKIDWKKPAEAIERQVRAFYPWPGSYAKINGKVLKIIRADILEQTKMGPFGSPGKTYLAPNDKIAVQTGKDFLIIEELQLEGKRAMSAAEFLRGNIGLIGTILK